MMSMELAFCEKLLPLPVSLSHRGGVPLKLSRQLSRGQGTVWGDLFSWPPVNEVCIKKFLRPFWETKKVRYTTNGRID